MLSCFKLKKKSDIAWGGPFHGVMPICKMLDYIDWTPTAKRPTESSRINFLGPVSSHDKQEGSAYLSFFYNVEDERPLDAIQKKPEKKTEPTEVSLPSSPPPPPVPQLSPATEELLNKQISEVPFPSPPSPLPQLSASTGAHLSKQMSEVPFLPPPPPLAQTSPTSEALLIKQSSEQIGRRITRRQRRRQVLR